jgi:hypothetical protein
LHLQLHIKHCLTGYLWTQLTRYNGSHKNSCCRGNHSGDVHCCFINLLFGRTTYGHGNVHLLVWRDSHQLMTPTECAALIHVVANENGVDPILFEAICRVESSLDPLAMRYEPKWNYLYFPREHASRLRITEETETQLQKFSYGLCQIMGSVAREHGFTGALVSLAADPALCLKFGAIHLKKFLWKYQTEAEAIAAYNAGSARRTPGGMFVNQQYVDKVDKVLRKLRPLI